MASHLGRTVAELEHTVSNAELHEWFDYYNQEPFFADRNEQQMAQLSTMVSSFMGGEAEMIDFMPSVEKKPKEVDNSKLVDQVMAVFGGLT